MKIDRRDIYSFLIAVFVVTITSIIQVENPMPEESKSVTASTTNTTASNNLIFADVD